MSSVFIFVVLSLLGASVLHAVFSKHNKRIIFLSVSLTGIALLVVLLFPLTLPSTYSAFWFSFGDSVISFSLLLNEMSYSMTWLILLVSFCIQAYSYFYFNSTFSGSTFYAHLSFFTLAMLLFAWSDNLLLSFACWEWIGYCSYRLIGLDKNDSTVADASRRVFIINRVGDVGFIIGMAIVWNEYHSFQLSSWTSLPNSALGFILFSVIGKSAQLPFSGWLLTAMKGPTPVSALLHSATLVVAGMYLLMQLPIQTDVLTPLFYIGFCTGIVASFASLGTWHIKKILAYSTLSNLGFIAMALSLSLPSEAFLHLQFHALQKAALFLLVGLVANALHATMNTDDSYDIRNFGGLTSSPLALALVLLSVASLVGIPFTPGILAKEKILHATVSQSTTYMLLLYQGISALTLLRPTWLLLFSSNKTTIVLSRTSLLPILLLIASAYGIGLYQHGEIFLSFDHSFLLSLSVILCALALSYFLFVRFRFQITFSFDKTMDAAYQKISLLAVYAEKSIAYFERGLARVPRALASVTLGFSLFIAWLDKLFIQRLLIQSFVGIGYSIGYGARLLIRGKIQAYIAIAAVLYLVILLYLLNRFAC